MGMNFRGQVTPALAVKRVPDTQPLPESYTVLMRPNKAKTAVHGCHCPGDIAVRIRKVLARLWVCVRVCQLL